MLRGYFDESGHESPEWVCVGGFIGTAEQWGDFVPKWRAALGQRPTLHMTDLRWKQERTRKLLDRLGAIPYACGLEGARGVVRVSDYADLVAGSSDKRIYTGYYACVNVMVMAILRGMPRGERIEFVFERQRQYASAVDLVMSILTDPATAPNFCFTPTGRTKIAKCEFVPKGSTLMTDPADYLAFALRELHANPNSMKSKWCAPILEGQTGYGSTLTREQVRRITKRAQAWNKQDGL
jgi:hypothetical protein